MYLITPENYDKLDFIDLLKSPEADERKLFNRDSLRHQKALFVKNLGWLLAQTRLDVTECGYVLSEYDGREFVIIRFRNGENTNVDITADSFVAIIRDVCKKL